MLTSNMLHLDFRKFCSLAIIYGKSIAAVGPSIFVAALLPTRSVSYALGFGRSRLAENKRAHVASRVLWRSVVLGDVGAPC